MLVLSRKQDEKIVIGNDIEITILRIERNRIRFGINAPQHIIIHSRTKTSLAPEKPAAVAQEANASAGSK